MYRLKHGLVFLHPQWQAVLAQTVEQIKQR
jgi:hypothetical protein